MTSVLKISTTPRFGRILLTLGLAVPCLAGIFLPPWAPALASESKTELEKIYEDVEYCRRPNALARMDAYLKSHPDDPDVLSMKGRYALLQERTAEAEKYFLRGIAASPKHERCIAGLSFCQVNDRNYKGAYENAVKAAAPNQIDPIYTMPDISLLKNLRVLCLKLGRAQEAREMEHQIKQIEYCKLAKDDREQGVLEKSLSILSQVLKNDPTVGYALLLRGVVYNNRSEHLKAIKDFDAVIALQPTLTNAYYFKGDSYFDLGNKAKALESWKQLLKIHPTSLPGLVAFDYVAMTGRFREHFEPNDQAIVNRADVYYLCGVAESDLKHYDLAIKNYTQCIALDKGEYKAYFERAALNEHLNHEGQVMADLNQAIKLNDKYIEALLERAKIYEKKQDNAHALADYSRVIAVNPSDFGSYILRADLEMRIKKYEQAVSDYSQAIKLSPSDDDPLMGRAKVYTAMRRFDDAMADYRQAMRLNPQDKAVVQDAMARVEKLRKSPALSLTSSPP